MKLSHANATPNDLSFLSKNTQRVGTNRKYHCAAQTKPHSILIAYSFLLCMSIPTAITAAIMANNQHIMLSVSTAKNASNMTMKIKISLNVDCFISSFF